MSKSISIIKALILKKWYVFCLMIFISISCAIITSFPPIIYKLLIESFENKQVTIKSQVLILFVIIIPIIILLLNFLKDRIIYNFSNYLSESLRMRAFYICLHMKYSQFEKIGYQKVLKILTREIGRICDIFFCGELLSLFNAFFQLIVVIMCLLKLNWIVSLMCLTIIPFMILIVNFYQKNIEESESKLMNSLCECDNYLTQRLLGIKTIKTLNSQNYECKEFNNWIKENKKISWKVKSQHSLARRILPNAAHEISLGIVLIFCAYFVMKNKMSVGTLVAIISYIPILFSTINIFFNTKIGYSAVKEALNGLDSILSSELEDGEIYQLNESTKAISFKNVEFMYERKGFNIKINKLDIESGDIIAIVGESGSGKSALFDILSKFYEVNDGCIEIFGVNINDINTDFLRDVLGLFSQEVNLWNKTIEENIIYPNPLNEKNCFKYNECLSNVGLDDFLNTLEYGDKTLLGDFGTTISGGQKQRIALARFLYNEHKILLLDEPTAALDIITSNSVFDMLVKVNQTFNKTIIVVTHDILKALNADKIIVIKNGRIVEYDTPEKLLSYGGEFKCLYNAFLENKDGFMGV